ncbi:hypothetical protein [Mycobacteroides abscessus]|uniref:hypothetical protein n=1 Tax=Mycobacteroides abscessus TaxID=36809 RepID=UPI0009A7E451|nr:hypothetical protein [Mycobacteroides abscessus]SKW04328.1 Uncharacterised protein [Mycobacteroides abscessus subsp. abscessus]
MSIESLSFHDRETGRWVTAKLKSARMIEGVLELNFGMPYDIDGQAVPVTPALESAPVEPKVAESR